MPFVERIVPAQQERVGSTVVAKSLAGRIAMQCAAPAGQNRGHAPSVLVVKEGCMSKRPRKGNSLRRLFQKYSLGPAACVGPCSRCILCGVCVGLPCRLAGSA